MRRRSPAGQVLSGALVAVVMTVAAVVVYVAFEVGTAAIRSGQGVRALQVGLVALVATVVAVLALTVYGHWIAVTEPPATSRRHRAPSGAELLVAGVVVVVLVLGSWPVLTGTVERASLALGGRDLAWTVGWGLLGVAYVWFVLFCLERYTRWVRRHAEVTRRTG